MKYPRLVKDFMMRTPITASLETEGLTEEGAPIEAYTYSGNCNYQDCAKKIITSNKEEVQLTGQAYINGDICPELAVISGGTLTVFGGERRIVQGMKARNPDGTVNYTRLDVV